MLTLPIKGKWFDMIASGEKPEEYRDKSPYYDSRLLRYLGQTVDVCLRNGYRADSRKLYCAATVTLGKGARPEWGGDPEKYGYILKIRSVRRAANDHNESN